MRAITEAEAIEAIKSKLSALSSYDVMIFKREPIQSAEYEAQIAIKAQTREVNQALIEELIRLETREDVPIVFGGTEIDVQSDLKVTYIFMNAKILAQV